MKVRSMQETLTGVTDNTSISGFMKHDVSTKLL